MSSSVYLVEKVDGVHVNCTLYVDCYRLALLVRAHTDFFAGDGGFWYVVAVTWQDAQARKLNALSFLVMAFLALFKNIFEALLNLL